VRCCYHKISKKENTCCRSTGSGDVSAAAKVDVDKVPSICATGVDGGGDSSDVARGHQLPLVVHESELPGWLCISVVDQAKITVSHLS